MIQRELIRLIKKYNDMTLNALEEATYGKNPTADLLEARTHLKSAQRRLGQHLDKEMDTEHA